MWSSRCAFGSLVTFLLVLAIPHAANAKEREAFRVVAPSGKAAWVTGATAHAWWHDYFSASRKNKRGCSCTSPAAAAQYAQKLARPWKRWPHPWLLVPTTDASMIYYPPTSTTRGYVLTPSVLGTNKSRWDDWEIVSARMAAIVRKALPSS